MNEVELDSKKKDASSSASESSLSRSRSSSTGSSASSSSSTSSSSSSKSASAHEQEVPIDRKYLENKNPISVEIKNLSVNVDQTVVPWKKKPLKLVLNNVSFTIHPGQMLAILGTSGSGKTTLLNAIGSRLEKRAHMEGDILLNGAKNSKFNKNAIGYVAQHESLLPCLTVRETLQYSALLRLPSSLSQQEQFGMAEETLLQLGLKDCADNRIGGAGTKFKGVSGGEKRRVSIGVQLLTNPSLLLLDEPTSGLDAFTANNIMEVLLELAKQNRTVICSIHQPRSDIFNMFDMVLLLSKGEVVYFGPAKEMVPYFSKYKVDVDEMLTCRLNFECPTEANPADYFLDISSVDYFSVESEAKTTKQVNKLIRAFQKHTKRKLKENKSKKKDENIPALPSNTNNRLAIQDDAANTSFWRSTPILTKRAYTNLFRSPDLALARIMQTFSLAAIIALCWWRFKDDQTGVQNRIGFLQQSLSLPFIGVLNCVALFPTERNVFYKEREDRMYGTAAFFMSYQLVELPLNFLGAAAFSLLSYFVLGMYVDAGAFFLFTFIIFLMVVQGETFGIIMCGFIYDIGLATSFAGVFVTVFTIMAGYFRPTGDLPWVLRVINYGLVFQYGAEILAVNEFQHLTFTCPGDQALSDGSCPFSTGDQVLETYTFKKEREWGYLGALIALVALYRLGAFFVLKYYKAK